MKKALLDDDSGVQKELVVFKSLIERQSAVVETLTLEYILENKRDLTELLNTACDSGKKIADIRASVDALTAGEKNRKLEQANEDRLDKLAGRLDVKREITNTTRIACHKQWLESVEGTGKWLYDSHEFSDWIDGKSDVDPLFFLIGDAGSGKSFIASSIVHRLQPDFVQGKKDRGQNLLAYHSFRKSNEKSGQDTKPVETALKSIALQIAEQDIAYAREIEKFCGTIKEGPYFRDLNCKGLWEDLQLAAPNPNRTFFLFLDDLDQLSGEPTKELLTILKKLRYPPADSRRTSTRVFVTGRADLFKNDLLAAKPYLDIERHNQPEIEHYVARGLKERDLLQGKDTETVKMMRMVLDKLSQTVQGNFSKVNTALGKIDDLVESDGDAVGLEKILKEAGQDWRSIAQNVVDDLAQQLSAREIEELNELLIWTVFGYEYFTIDQLQAALVSSSFPAYLSTYFQISTIAMGLLCKM